MLPNKCLKRIQLIDKMKGFSILEMVIVLLIVGVMAVVSFPFLQSVPSIYLQTDEMAADIIYTQSLSMGTGQPHHLKYFINTNPDTYEIRNLSTGIIVKTVTFQKGVSIFLNGFFNNQLIAFDGLGIPYINEPVTNSGNQFGQLFSGFAAGYIELTDTKGNFATIFILPRTGLVYVYHGTYQQGLNSSYFQ